MREIEAFEAENKLSALLDEVERGAEVVITRDGKPVARLVPPPHAAGSETAHAAAEAIRSMSKGTTLGGLQIRHLIEEGRR